MSRAVSPRPRHIAAVLAAVALAVPLGACGREKTTTFGATEGTYLDVGPLAYQVQISRALNPQDSEDRNYMQGVQAALATDETWFAIFMRVKNQSGETLTPTTTFTITDTEGNKFQPVTLDEKVNPFIYLPEPLEHAHVLPDANTPPGSGPVQGSLILFKIDAPSLQNRPLILTIGEGEDSATVDLDL